MLKKRDQLINWGWALLGGIISTSAGLFVVLNPSTGMLLTTTFLIYFLGIAAIISGIMSINTGLKSKNGSGYEWPFIIGGLLWVVFGVLLVGSPLLSVTTLAKIIGFLGIFGGIAIMISGFNMIRLSKIDPKDKEEVQEEDVRQTFDDDELDERKAA